MFLNVDWDMLILLSSIIGFISAYSEGNPKLAERYFRSIENVDLQFSIDTTRKNLSSNKY